MLLWIAIISMVVSFILTICVGAPDSAIPEKYNMTEKVATRLSFVFDTWFIISTAVTVIGCCMYGKNLERTADMVNEIELVSLSNDTLTLDGERHLFYASRSPENVYTYRYEVQSEFATNSSKEYKLATISGNVTEIEDPNCTKAVLRIYKVSYSNIWDQSEEYEYVFYVPEGTISNEVQLS